MASEVRSATKTIDAVAEIDLIVSISLSHSRSSHFPDSSLTRAGEGLQSIAVGRVFIAVASASNRPVGLVVIIVESFELLPWNLW